MPHKDAKKGKEREKLRLAEPSGEGATPPWHRWGPYVAERAWGTVREDYSDSGDAWSYFPFEKAHTKAYRWGEDGIAGWCDRYQLLVFAPAFWNGKDPILKERLFGLGPHDGNHGEDVKELYYHLDGIPSHAYMKYLYKYPQQQFPYELMREENRKKTGNDVEYEITDTGIFNEGRYFDIFIEYAKVDAEDVIIKIEAYNRYSEAAPLHILPQLWFRNRWSSSTQQSRRPKITALENHSMTLLASDEEDDPLANLPFSYRLGKRYLYASGLANILFTENNTADAGNEDALGYKDAFHKVIVEGRKEDFVRKEGTKSCIHYHFPSVPPSGSVVVYLRLSNKELMYPLEDAQETLAMRKKEADEFYSSIHPEHATEEERRIQRQALAGLCWSKQIYLYDVSLWLDGDNKDAPPPSSRLHIRNIHWRHLNSMRILSMPDKWEYPWFAAWDQAFHSVCWSLIDIDFAKEQLWLLLFDQFQHPNGQIPAYEWEFSDLNPPIQAWAALKIFYKDKQEHGKRDCVFLEKCFHKLLMNFSWWVNKVDSSGNNVFEGGFLGLDNITVVDRSLKLRGGVKLQQSDGTGWMAFFCLNMMRMALELAEDNRVYESLATKFFEHYIYIAHAMKKRGDKDYELWSEKDGFFYDVLTYPDGSFAKFRVRSLVGIIPFFAGEYISEKKLKQYPSFYENFTWFMNNRPDLVQSSVIVKHKGGEKYFVLTPMNKEQMQSLLKYIWDTEEFRSQYGLRSLSKYHMEHPFVFEDKKVYYEPAESTEKIKGGNSNWRGPVWIPTTYLLIEALRRLARVFGDDLRIEGITLDHMAKSFSSSLLAIFTKNSEGKRPFYGPFFPYASDDHFQDFLLFYEYYHAESGKGLGASHQCGWSALIANVIDELRGNQDESGG